jgi:hypothetical protein
MKTILLYCLLMLPMAAMAQYAPQAGQAGSTAISASSSEITGWATHCDVQRGYVDIANTSLGNVTAGSSAEATGNADGSIVCLGDSGVATLTFNAALYNGPGADFAVFENGFKDPANSAMAFLELAFVEVSSDGVNFFRFPVNSNTPTNTQIPGSGVYMDASLINGVAGKYISTFGTPFDLEELKDMAGLDVNNITHVRIVDVVGSVSGHSSYDQTGKVINDPYPTNFPTGGFDLDAVGAIHQYSTGLQLQTNKIKVSVFPNPATEELEIATAENTANMHATLVSVSGNTLITTALTGKSTTLQMHNIPAGMYYLFISDSNGAQWVEKIVKY